MGCSNSSSTDLEQQILPLPIDIINAYIDRVSIVMINKIKDKFLSQLPKQKQQMNEMQFVSMLKHLEFSDARKRSLFAYFTNNSKRPLRISKFIEKYCILIKSDAVHFSQIIHRIFCRSIDYDRMTTQDFRAFEDECHRYIKEGINIPADKFPVPWSIFFQSAKNVVDWEEFQSSFHIVSIDELPYKSFHQELQRFNMEFLQKGNNYFVVSAQWISQWIFFYEYEDTDIKNSNYRSARSSQLIRKKSLTVKRKVSKNRLSNSKIISHQNTNNMSSLLPPTEINMTDIEGQYMGELKPFLNVERDIAVINKKMWLILKNTLGSSVEFEREAIDEYNLELYPVFVYYFRVENNGIISSESLQIVRAKRTLFLTQFKMLLTQSHEGKQINNCSLYYKNLQQLNFSQWLPDKCLQDLVDENPRVIIIQVPAEAQQKFIGKYMREEMKSETVTIGDRVLAYFSYEDKFVEAFVINARQQKKQLKVHFIGYSYNYERWIKHTDIKLLQTANNQQGQTNQMLYQKQALFWGIPNIGNTCFINSILQSLTSTSIFDQFFLKANLSEKKYPLSYEFSKVLKGLVNREKFYVHELKKAINVHMPIFSGYDQHDAQQFLNLLLDKMDEQLNQKPNIIDELFGGIMQSKFTCLQCKETKTKEQKIHSISLPIPQAEFNYFTIMIFPIYSSHVRKIILRLHKNAKVNEYLREIQIRTNIDRLDMLYVEAQNSGMKKFRNQLIILANEEKKVTDLGLNSNVELWAYEKLRTSSIQYQLKEKKINSSTSKDKMASNNKISLNHFYDFYSNEQASWGIAKVTSLDSQKVNIQFLKDNLIKEIQLQRENKLENQFNDLGSKFSDKVFRKVLMRHWSPTSQKMVFFANQLFLGIPRWSSYKDTLVFFDQCLQKLSRNSHMRISRNTSKSESYEDIGQIEAVHEDQLRLTGMDTTLIWQKKQPYVIHFLQIQKNCCIFCQKQLQPFHSLQEVRRCCQPQEKDISLYWLSKEKFIYFIVDWVDIEEYNENYFNKIDMDNTSIAAEQKMRNEKITLEECLELWRKPETIEMQCQKCKFDEHLLETSIKKAPIITVFHLKEFRYTQQGHFIKLNINLQWSESINLETYCSPSSSTQKGIYEMYSVISHRGNTNSGHYTSMAKRKHPLEKTKVWVNFDDERTEVLKQQPQTIQNAYLLFFKKVDIPSSAVVHFSI